MDRFEKYLERIGIEPKNLQLYRRALTHLSAAKAPSESYERLEFLGDSVIGLVISEYLYRTFPDKEEGELTRIKALVVSRDILGEKSRHLGLGKYIKVDTARVRERGAAEISILSDCFESLVAAIIIDRGYTAAKKFILMHLKDYCLKMKNQVGPTDQKSQLQELWQHRYKVPPEYVVVKESGPDHRKTFMIEVRYKENVLGKGSGNSKKKAEQEAAADALKKINRREKRKRV